MEPCPSDEQLAKLLAEQLSVDEATLLARHMDECRACRQRLAQLRADSHTVAWHQLLRPTHQEEAGTGLAPDAGSGPAVAREERSGSLPDQTGAADSLTHPGGEAELLQRLQQAPAPAAGRSGRMPVLPGYELLSELGRGGAGIVYLARQERLKRLVALKFLVPDATADAELTARFRAEAEVSARLRHPNIVQIHDFGEQDGVPYLALEYVEGGSLDRALAGMPQEPREAARLLEVLARAMQYAHDQGIIHRDLKPGNILLDRGGIPKITDFGLAKQQEDRQGLTQTGQVVGTLSYMAPEQAQGQGHQVGPVSDVYALGAILYEMLTSRPPFKGRTVLDTLEQVRSAEPVPPRHLVPNIPRDLQTICLKCLDKEPRRRYASAAELAEDLRRFLGQEPIQARPVGWWTKSLKWARRRPTAAALVLVSLFGTLLLLGGSFWYNGRLRVERDRAEVNFQLALKAVDEMLREVGEEQLASEPHMEEKRLALLGKALAFAQHFQRQKGEEPGVRYQTALAFKRVGDIQRLLGQSVEAQEAYSQAIGLLERLHAGEPDRADYGRDLASCHNYLGEVLRLGGSPRQAEQAYRRAQAQQEQLVERDLENRELQQELAQIRCNLGILCSQTNQTSQAEELLRQAIDQLQKLVEKEPQAVFRQHLARAYLNLGPVLRATRRFDEAEDTYGQALKLLEPLTRETPEKPDYRHELAVVCNNLGNVRSARQHFTEARQAHEQAIELFAELARDFPGVPIYRQELANSYNSLASVLIRTGQRDDATTTWRRAEKLLRDLVGQHPKVASYHGDLGLTLGNLGWALSARQDWARARPKHEQAVVQLQAALGIVPRDQVFRQALRDAYRNLAETLLQLGQPVPAAAAADALAALSLDPGPDTFMAACFQMRCWRLVEQDKVISEPERQRLLKGYGDRALALLKQASHAGYRCPDQGAPDPYVLFEPLLHQDGFRALLDQLQGKARPAP